MWDWTKPGVVYGLHDGDGRVRHVGYTTMRLNHRLNAYRATAKEGNPSPVHAWIRENGGHVEAIVLEECADRAALHEAEARWVARFRAEQPDLLNVAAGGAGAPDHPITERMREVGRANRGRVFSEESKAKMRAAKAGKPWSAARRAAHEAKR
jgi:hypothetical protein